MERTKAHAAFGNLHHCVRTWRRAKGVPALMQSKPTVPIGCASSNQETEASSSLPRRRSFKHQDGLGKAEFSRHGPMNGCYLFPMSAKIPSGLIKELRHQIASAIYDSKSYEVPALCVRLGLAEGTEEEAFSSKYKYAQKRLAGLNAHALQQVAAKMLEIDDFYSLSEAAAKLDELEGAQLSDLTRKRLMTVFDGYPLTTETEELEFLRQLWPIAALRRADDPDDGRSLEEAIVQHTIRNADWDNRDLLKACGFTTVSRRQLFRFLAAAVDPLAQNAEAQARLVKALNEHLRHDGYELKEVRKISGSPRFEVQPLALGSPADESITAALNQFSPTDVHSRWMAALERRSTDPAGAITLARTLLEDVCKWI